MHCVDTNTIANVSQVYITYLISVLQWFTTIAYASIFPGAVYSMKLLSHNCMAGSCFSVTYFDLTEKIESIQS